MSYTVKRSIIILAAFLLLVGLTYLVTQVYPTEDIAIPSPRRSLSASASVASSPTPAPLPPEGERVPASRERIEAEWKAVMQLGEHIARDLTAEARARVDEWREKLSPQEMITVSPSVLSLLAELLYLEHLEADGMASDYEWEQFEAVGRQLLEGSDPYDDLKGTFNRGYISPVDGTLQTYSVSVPLSYKPDGSYPLLVSLHHHGWSDWFRPFQGHPAPLLDDAIVVSPHGRGSADYMWVAEEETFAAIEDAMRCYPVDRSRVYCTGYSMGGTGSWYLATRRPHMFAAIAPVAGNADFTAWVKKWDWRLHDESPIAFLRQFMRESTCAAAYAENLANVKVLCYHGAHDDIVPVEHARGMVDRLKQLGYAGVEYRETEAFHASRPLSELWEWLKQHRTEAIPRKVVYRTNGLRHNKAYHVTLHALAEPEKYSLIEVNTGQGSTTVTTDGVVAFELDFRIAPAGFWQKPQKPYDIKVGEQLFSLGEAPTRRLFFRNRDGKWFMQTDPSPEGMGIAGMKRPGVSGPIEDAFARPFLLVWGDTGNDQALAQANREEAERMAQNWLIRYRCTVPVKAASEVTDDDIAAYNLILYGNARNNTVLARVSDRLPIGFGHDSGGVVLQSNGGERSYYREGIGFRLVYPNPLNPDRYVVVNSANSVAGMHHIEFRFGNWFDWIPYDNRGWYDYCVFDNQTISPETFLEAGFFDRNWKLSGEYSFFGQEETRRTVLPRLVPASAVAPEADTVWLDELRPVRSFVLRGSYNLNRSWAGGPLSAYGLPFKRGIGTRISSALMWDARKSFRHFRATIGIDYEGGSTETITSARRSAEVVKFAVIGDGRVLFESSYMDSAEKPLTFDVNIEGVSLVTLVAERATPQGWLYGSVCWGDARFER